VTGGEEGFAEVASDDVFSVANGGKVDAGVPAEKYIDVRRYILELSGRQDSRFPSTPLRASLTGPSARFGMTRGQKGPEQFGDRGRLHLLPVYGNSKVTNLAGVAPVLVMVWE
jgi:hypothetical protein